MSRRLKFFEDDTDLGQGQIMHNEDVAISRYEDNIQGPNKPVIQKARYRCEQINVTKVNGIVSSNSTQKFQYEIELDLLNRKALVKLVDHYYNMNPPVINKIFEFITKTEMIRNDLNFRFDGNGKLEKILSQQYQEDKWLEFKKSTEFHTEFIRTLEVTNPDGLKALIDEGDLQFLSTRNTEEEHRRNLFIWVLFDKHLFKDEASDDLEIFLFQSHLVPPQTIPLLVSEKVISREEKKSIWRKEYKIDRSEKLIDEIRASYDIMHKPNLHFNFTDYNLEIYISKEVEEDSRLVVAAKMRLSETIEDNLESYFEYTIRKL